MDIYTNKNLKTENIIFFIDFKEKCPFKRAFFFKIDPH